MNKAGIQHKDWLIHAGVFGLIALPSYLFSAVFVVPIPAIERILFFVWGPTFALAVYCMGHWMRRDYDSIALRLAVMMNVGAGMIVTIMAAVQTLNGAISVEKIDGTTDEQLIWLYKAAFTGTNHTQLGIDVAFDVWVSLGTALFALATVRHFAFRPWLGIAGIVVALGTLINNLIHFPWPPADRGGVDGGPLVGVWWGLLLSVIAFQFWRDSSTTGSTGNPGSFDSG